MCFFRNLYAFLKARTSCRLLRLLAEHGIHAAVVSMPSWEKFEQQDAAYQASVLGIAPRIGVEAAARMGWDRWLGENGHFIGMPGFGASAPASDLYRHFGITSDAVIEAARRMAGAEA